LTQIKLFRFIEFRFVLKIRRARQVRQTVE
jgi:hypothetical protein